MATINVCAQRNIVVRDTLKLFAHRPRNKGQLIREESYMSSLIIGVIQNVPGAPKSPPYTSPNSADVKDALAPSMTGLMPSEYTLPTMPRYSSRKGNKQSNNEKDELLRKKETLSDERTTWARERFATFADPGRAPVT